MASRSMSADDLKRAGLIVCAVCKEVCPRTGPGQSYCPSCSEKRDLERKKLWARKNPPKDKARVRANAKRRKTEYIEAGKQINVRHAKSIVWMNGNGPKLAWLSRFSIPFSYASSKNHIYTMRANGHVALRKESKAIKELVALKAKEIADKMPVVNAKVWIDILVQKPNHKGDAINVVDLICDGLKVGLGVDDRWFCIRQLDWQIVKTEPKLFIGVGQVDKSHRRVCSHCGLILKLDKFNKAIHDKHFGVARACRKCCSSGAKMGRAD